jgi:hypothetical protein
MPKTEALYVLPAGFTYFCRNPFKYFVCSSMSGLYDGDVFYLFSFVFWGWAFGSLSLEKLIHKVSEAIC